MRRHFREHEPRSACSDGAAAFANRHFAVVGRARGFADSDIDWLGGL